MNQIIKDIIINSGINAQELENERKQKRIIVKERLEYLKEEAEKNRSIVTKNILLQILEGYEKSLYGSDDNYVINMRISLKGICLFENKIFEDGEICRKYNSNLNESESEKKIFFYLLNNGNLPIPVRLNLKDLEKLDIFDSLELKKEILNMKVNKNKLRKLIEKAKTGQLQLDYIDRDILQKINELYDNRDNIIKKQKRLEFLQGEAEKNRNIVTKSILLQILEEYKKPIYGSYDNNVINMQLSFSDVSMYGDTIFEDGAICNKYNSNLNKYESEKRILFYMLNDGNLPIPVRLSLQDLEKLYIFDSLELKNEILNMKVNKNKLRKLIEAAKTGMLRADYISRVGYIDKDILQKFNEVYDIVINNEKSKEEDNYKAFLKMLKANAEIIYSDIFQDLLKEYKETYDQYLRFRYLYDDDNKLLHETLCAPVKLIPLGQIPNDLYSRDLRMIALFHKRNQESIRDPERDDIYYYEKDAPNNPNKKSYLLVTIRNIEEAVLPDLPQAVVSLSLSDEIKWESLRVCVSLQDFDTFLNNTQKSEQYTKKRTNF